MGSKKGALSAGLRAFDDLLKSRWPGSIPESTVTTSGSAPISDYASFIRDMVDNSARLPAPEVLSPAEHRTQDIFKLIDKTRGADQVRRLERAADEGADLSLFTPRAIEKAIRPDLGYLFTNLEPGRFQDFAARIPDDRLTQFPYVLAKDYKNPDPNKWRLPDVLENYANIGRQRGWHDVPELKVGVQPVSKMLGYGLDSMTSGSYPLVLGHEGRHRTMAMDQVLKQPKALTVVRVPDYEQDNYLNHMNDGEARARYLRSIIERSGNKVIPEDTSYYPIWNRKLTEDTLPQLPELFGGGGPVKKGILSTIERLAEGKPKTFKLNGVDMPTYPIREIEDIAESFAKKTGKNYPIESFAPFDEDRARRIANAFEEMQHNPFDYPTKRAYEALIDETMDQYKALDKLGLNFEFMKPGEGNPYKTNPALGYTDLLENGRMKVFLTLQPGAFGTLEDVENNPLLRHVGRVGDLENGTANDAFRVVHDVFGHYGPGNPFFRAKGEDRAWKIHGRSYSDDALPAATTELRGQNSWVNHGPYGEFNRTANQDDTIYAKQKVGLLPSWVWDDAYADGGPVEMKKGGWFVNFIKNLESTLEPEKQELLKAIREPSLKTGDEHFGVGRVGDGISDIVRGNPLGVTIPSWYERFVGQSPKRFFTAHTHLNSSINPSKPDLDVWSNIGKVSMPYQDMLIQSLPNDSLLQIGTPGASGSVAGTLRASRARGAAKGMSEIYDPILESFLRGNGMPSLGEMAETAQVHPKLVKKFSPLDAVYNDMVTGPYLNHLGKIGVPVDVDAGHTIAGTPHLASDVWPELTRLLDKNNLSPFAEGGSVGYKTGSLVKKVAKSAADWKWRPLEEVRSDLGNIDEIPPHVLDYGDFMKKMAHIAGTEGLTPADLLKAYATTRMSIQRRALDSNILRSAGLKVDGDTIRPEGAISNWFRTKLGEKYLDEARYGGVYEPAVNNAVDILRPFGKYEDIRDFLEWGPKNLPGRESRFSELVDRAARGVGDASEWNDALEGVRGIGPSKRGFFGSLIGNGQLPTLDARQIILHSGQPTSAAKPFLKNPVPYVERLADRQRELDLKNLPEYEPFYQHLAHHSIWDRAGNEVTTHKDLIDSMLYRAEGGPVGYKAGSLVKKIAGALSRASEAHEVPAEEVHRAISKSVRAPNNTISDIVPKRSYGDSEFGLAPGTDMLPETILRPEDLKGRTIAGTISDRLNTGHYLTDVAGTSLGNPIYLEGGFNFPRGHAAKESALWASQKGPMTAIHRRLKEIEDEFDAPVSLTPLIMGRTSLDSTRQMSDVLGQIVDGKSLSRDAAAYINKAMRERFPTWPGIKSDRWPSWQSYLNIGDRSFLPQLLDKAAVLEGGGPNMGDVRIALTGPEALMTPNYHSGRVIGSVDTSTPPRTGDLHSGYNSILSGQYQGGFGRWIPPEVMFGRDWEERFAKGNPSALSRRVMMRPLPRQYMDQEAIDRISKYIEDANRLGLPKATGGRVDAPDEGVDMPTGSPFLDASPAEWDDPRDSQIGDYRRMTLTPEERRAARERRRRESDARIGMIREEASRDPMAYYGNAARGAARGALSIGEFAGLPGTMSEANRSQGFPTMDDISGFLDRLLPHEGTGGQAGYDVGELLPNMLGVGASQHVARKLPKALNWLGDALNLGTTMGSTGYAEGGLLDDVSEPPSSQPIDLAQRLSMDEMLRHASMDAARLPPPMMQNSKGGGGGDIGAILSTAAKVLPMFLSEGGAVDDQMLNYHPILFYDEGGPVDPGAMFAAGGGVLSRCRSR